MTSWRRANWTEAKAIFRDILQQDPGNPLALNNLGAVMVKEKKYQEALNYLEQALPRAEGLQGEGEPGVRGGRPLPGLSPLTGSLRRPGPGAPGANSISTWSRPGWRPR